MIEIVLLIGLGFLCAMLLVMLLAPSIHRRVVRYTENRLRATMPISPQEVQAQRDMARAAYAAENARARQELIRERENLIASRLQGEVLSREASRLNAENQDFKILIEDMNVDAGDMRSRLRRKNEYIDQLKLAISRLENDVVSRDSANAELKKRLVKLTVDIDNLRIDLATRDTDAENQRYRASALRSERDEARHDLKLMTGRAGQAEKILTVEQRRRLEMEEKLHREIAAGAGRDDTIERRLQEIARLKQKLETLSTESQETERAFRAAELTKAGLLASAAPRDADVGEVMPFSLPSKDFNEMSADLLQSLGDDVRLRSTALNERLLAHGENIDDEAMREEIASIAAKMVVLTAGIEGPASPIRTLITAGADTDIDAGQRTSLAARVAKLLPSPPQSKDE